MKESASLVASRHPSALRRLPWPNQPAMTPVRTVPVIGISGAWSAAAGLSDFLSGLSTPDVYASDLRGHGTDARSLDSVSIRDYADDIVGEIGSSRFPSPCMLVGWSMGGLIAQLIADTRPDLVKGVVLLASVPPKGIQIPFSREMFRRLFKIRYIKALVTGKAFSLTDEDAAFIRGEAKWESGQESGRAFGEYLLGNIPFLFEGISVSPLKCPTLVIGFHDDHLLPITLQTKIWKHHSGSPSNCSFVSMPGHHMAHLDDRYKGAVLEEIQKFHDGL